MYPRRDNAIPFDVERFHSAKLLIPLNDKKARERKRYPLRADVHKVRYFEVV